MAREKSSSTSHDIPEALAKLLGVRRTARLKAVMRRTELPPEELLDLAIELLDIASRRLTPDSIRRTAVGLGAARWRNVSPEERSELLRKAAEARWAKQRKASAP